jgi:glycosyltransferase involved in cell wall biosynthesis
VWFEQGNHPDIVTEIMNHSNPDKNMRLFFWPHYSNPYQMLFYGPDTQQFTSEPAPIEDAIAALDAEPESMVVFHLHWLNFLFRSKNSGEHRTSAEAFIAQCRAFVEAGGTLVWTVHNLVEHEKTDAELEQDVRTEISRLAACIFVHGNHAFDAVSQSLPDVRDKLHVIEHGNYIGSYENTVDPETAKRVVGLFGAQKTLLSLGWVRRYKGLDSLCTALQAVPGARLVVAGSIRKPDKSYFEELFGKTTNVIVREGWIADDSVQYYTNSADFMVLPYVSSLTSGAALLSFSFSLPLIAPRIGNFPEIIQDGIDGFLYDPDDENALVEAISRAVSLDASKIEAMRHAAYQRALSFQWERARKVFIDTIRATASLKTS